MEETCRWFVDHGGKMDQVILITDTIPQEILLTVGFIRIPSNSAGFVRIPSNTSPSYKVDNIKFLEMNVGPEYSF